jgi:flagellar hook protein FlgE
VGSGVRLTNVSQQFTQGNINYTQNALDLAINGKGFFQVSNNGAMSFTRSGYFGTNREGFLVDNFGNNLQGYTVENEQLGKMGNLRIQSTNQEPRPTSRIDQNFNLNSTNTAPINAFNPTDPSSYNSSTSTNIYDAQGNAHVMTQYFVKTGPNSWNMNVLIDGAHPESLNVNSPSVLSLQFDEAGKLTSVGGDIVDSADAATVNNLWQVNADGSLTLQPGKWVPAQPGTDPAMLVANEAAASLDGIRLDIRGATQYASSFGVNSVSQDGYTTGQLAGLEIDETGNIFARYTNGQSKIQGQVVLASFANEQGLKPIGNNQWVQSFASGEPVPNPPGSATLGLLQAGALEDSNVELSDQLVNLIVAQRNYQANAKTIETESAITQTLINMR